MYIPSFNLADRVKLSKGITDQNGLTSAGVVVETTIIDPHEPMSRQALLPYQRITVEHDDGATSEGGAHHYELA